MGHPLPAPSPTLPCLLGSSFCPQCPLDINPTFIDHSLLGPSGKPSLSICCMHDNRLSAVTTETHKAKVPPLTSFQDNVGVTYTRRWCRCPGNTKEGPGQVGEGVGGWRHVPAGSDTQRCYKKTQQDPGGRWGTRIGVRIPTTLTASHLCALGPSHSGVKPTLSHLFASFRAVPSPLKSS